MGGAKSAGAKRNQSGALKSARELGQIGEGLDKDSKKFDLEKP